jgi:hypothetical protein
MATVDSDSGSSVLVASVIIKLCKDELQQGSSLMKNYVTGAKK